jgi:hypothetical protein
LTGRRVACGGAGETFTSLPSHLFFALFLYVGVAGHAVALTPAPASVCSVYTGAGYVFVRNEGVCYATSVLPGGAAAVPVTLWYNGADDNLGAPAAPSDGQGWQDVDLECWAYAAAGGSRLPLELWHNSELSEYWTLADPTSRAEAVAAGYTLLSTLGYVDSAPTATAATPDPATVASWAQVLRIDW